jgi:hypothetical protein
MPATIPMLFEGTPFHADNSLQAFNGTASAGQVVTLTGPYTVGAASGNGAFVLGVAITSGILGPVTVALRGIVDVIVDGAVNAGSYLVPSNTTAGRVVATTFLNAFSNGNVPRAIALSSATTAGQTIQALIW